MSDYGNDPKELIRIHYPLQGVVAPLTELIKVNPAMTEQLVEFALVCGIRAAYQLQADHERTDLVEMIRRRFFGMDVK